MLVILNAIGEFFLTCNEVFFNLLILGMSNCKKEFLVRKLCLNKCFVGLFALDN